VLTVPVLDTTLVTVTRIRRGVSPFQGGRDHSSHRLVRLGLRVPTAVAVIALVGLAHACLALLVARIDVTAALILLGAIVTVDALGLAALARVPVHDEVRPVGP
jgi:UDP-GlcNAc:undecaprenyl-phosphate GlcNAc-1-phosphate transferase